MYRRHFLATLGATSVLCWAWAANGQQVIHRVAVIMVQREGDPQGQQRLAALLRGMDKLGWREGANLHIDVRWAGGTAERMRELSAEVSGLNPDVIVASGTPTVSALKRSSSSLPIVFVAVNEPVAQGFVQSIARPGGNVTGFTQTDFSTAGKSVEMLNAMAPGLKRIGLMYNPDTYAFYDAYLEKFQTEPRWPIEFKRVAVRAVPDISSAIKEFASEPYSGLVVMVDSFNTINQAAIQKALAENPLPHIVPWRSFVGSGGLMSYGPDVDDIFSRSADYVDRILKGAKPEQLPVQAPTAYELAINLKTAKSLGLVVPPSLIAIANDVTE